MMLVAEVTHLPMDTGQPSVPSGTFQPELTGPGYTPSLIGSMDTPPSPITDVDNALLDITDPRAQAPETSKAPGAGRLEGSPSQGLQGLSVPFACVGSGDPVRVLCLYTMNTLDIL